MNVIRHDCAALRNLSAHPQKCYTTVLMVSPYTYCTTSQLAVVDRGRGPNELVRSSRHVVLGIPRTRTESRERETAPPYEPILVTVSISVCHVAEPLALSVMSLQLYL